MTSSDEYEVVGHIAWDSLQEIVALLRSHGLHPMCETQPTHTPELTRHWVWRLRPATSSTPLSVPKSEAARAATLLKEWRREKHRHLGPVTARIRRDVALAIGGFVLVAAALSLWLRDVEQGVTYAFFVALVVFALAVYLKPLIS